MKADKYIPRIIECNDKSEAIKILVDIADDLGISQSHNHLLKLKTSLEEYQQRFRDLTDQYASFEIPTFEQIQSVRLEANFILRDMVDECAYEVSYLRQYYGEDRRTVVKAESITDMRNNEKYKGQSDAALDRVKGESKIYREYITLSSLSSALASKYKSLFDVIRMFTDSLASAARSEYLINAKDVK